MSLAVGTRLGPYEIDSPISAGGAAFARGAKVRELERGLAEAQRSACVVMGTKIGPYEIVAPLGAGGMGEVYRARDTKLNRDVALKVLPASFADDADRLARFEREAQVLASLNHPNIATIYGLEESDGVSALVMELVEGDDLAQRMLRGAAADRRSPRLLPRRSRRRSRPRTRRASFIAISNLPTSRSRADGTREGARLRSRQSDRARERVRATADAMNSPTLTARDTEAGMILGTAAYMAPEQARGKAVDKRADIWAFGVVLFEMLTGQRAVSRRDDDATRWRRY